MPTLLWGLPYWLQAPSSSFAVGRSGALGGHRLRSHGPSRTPQHGFWTRRTRLAYWFLLGPIILAAGLGFLSSGGWNATTIWYLSMGGLFFIAGTAELLGVFPPDKRARIDALDVLGRPRVLVVALLVGAAVLLVAVLGTGMSLLDGLLRFAAYASFFALVFGSARRRRRAGADPPPRATGEASR